MDRYIYLGPNLAKAGLIKGQVYKGGLPPKADELTEKYPLLHLLFCKVSEIAVKEKNIKTPGTPENLSVMQIKGGGK